MFVDHGVQVRQCLMYICLWRDMLCGHGGVGEFPREVEQPALHCWCSRCGEQELDSTATSEHHEDSIMRLMSPPLPFSNAAPQTM